MLEKEALEQVLNYAKVPELPKPMKAGAIFVRAIVKVKKANNHESLCYAVNDGYGTPVIKKVFGSLSMINTIEEIYPLSYLEEGVLPDFRKKADVVQFLARHGMDEQKASSLVMSEDKEERTEAKKEVVRCCVMAQLRRESIETNNKNTNKEYNTNVTNETDTDNSDTLENTGENPGVTETV